MNLDFSERQRFLRFEDPPASLQMIRKKNLRHSTLIKVTVGRQLRDSQFAVNLSIICHYKKSNTIASNTLAFISTI